MTETARKSILFVDEDEGLRRFCAEVLTDAGYRVEEASSGTEALFKLRRAAYDLVITDLRLRGMDGIGLYFMALKIYSEMRERFLFMTAEACADLESGAVMTRLSDRYLAKPFEAGELLKKVEGLTGENLTAFLMRYRNTGGNRRRERRYCWTEDFTMLEDAREPRPFTQTSDISRSGLKIRYLGSPMKEDNRVGVTVRCLNLRTTARIVWSIAIDRMEAVSGLSLDEPVSAAAIMEAISERAQFVPPLVSNRA